MTMRHLYAILAAVAAMLSCLFYAEATELDRNSAYYFDGSISREGLARYLARSVTATYLLVAGRPEG